jgi:small basic protein (TIGR04137 family)
MSIDKSLVVKSRLKRHRNVLTRAERVEKLKEEETWEGGRSVLGLPKVRNIKKKPKKTIKAVEKAEGAEEATPAAEGASAASGDKGEKTEKAK